MKFAKKQKKFAKKKKVFDKGIFIIKINYK